jgi:isocitrate dehydrogenase
VAKIKVERPVVEMEGDEMARIMWHGIRDRLILPFLDIELVSFDLSLPERDRTGDRVTIEAAHAARQHGVAVKCATITHNEERLKEFNSPRMLPSPNGTIRDFLDGTIFREPVICRNVPRIVPHWVKPVVIARHGFGDQYRATELRHDRSGTIRVSFVPDDGSQPLELEVYRAPGPGVAMAMYNQDESIRGFARACFNYALQRRYPVYLSTKETILKVYDARFRALFEEVLEREFRERMVAAGLSFEHRLIDDMVASSLKWDGGYLWACKNYDGDVQSDALAQGYGSPGLMTSVLMTPDASVVETEAAHGSVTRHYRLHQEGKPTSTNPIASLFAWTRALHFRGRMDGSTQVIDFADRLERSAVGLVEAGVMTRDLAARIAPDHPYVTTDGFIDALAEELARQTT